MNFLAHIFLSGNSDETILGNFIADSVKGNKYYNFSPEIAKGILLHRAIDSYTDSHPIVELSKIRLREKYRKYAGVIVDVLYDHFLAINWNSYSNLPLDVYAQKIYQLIETNEAILPENSKRFMFYMIKNDALFAYSDINKIELVLRGMAQRTKFVSNMEYAIHDIKEHYDSFQEEFIQFFPQIQDYVRKYKIEKH